MASQLSFNINEMVGYKGRICLIQGIAKTILGYNTYTIEDIDSDAVFVAHKHELSKVAELDLTDDIVFDESPAAVPPTAPLESQNNRFHELKEHEVDAIADARTAKNTNTQTKWALNILRGEYQLILGKYQL